MDKALLNDEQLTICNDNTLSSNYGWSRIYHDFGVRQPAQALGVRGWSYINFFSEAEGAALLEEVRKLDTPMLSINSYNTEGTARCHLYVSGSSSISRTWSKKYESKVWLTGLWIMVFKLALDILVKVTKVLIEEPVLDDPSPQKVQTLRKSF